MNERIKELAEQAGFMVDQSGSIMVCFTSNGDSEVKKFAELIVRECIGIAYEYDAPKMSGPGMIIAIRIEKHFGVEE